MGVRCMLVLGGYRRQRSGVGAVHAGLLPARMPRSAFAGQKAVRPADPARRLWEILWPVEGGRVLASALHTAEYMLVPACLAVYLINAGGRTAALEQYGELKGMALPLLTFPFGLLGQSFGAADAGDHAGSYSGPNRTGSTHFWTGLLRLTGYFSALAGGAVLGVGTAAGTAFVPKCGCRVLSGNAGSCHALMYLESMVDGAMKGVGEQKAAFRYSVWDSILRIGGVVALLPRFGMKGFLAVILLSSLYTCAANTGHLLFPAARSMHSAAGWVHRHWQLCWPRRLAWRCGSCLRMGLRLGCLCSWPRWA